MKKNFLQGYKLLGYYLSIFLIMIGCIVLTPLLTLIAYPEEAANNATNFIIPGISCILVGYVFNFLLKKDGVSNLKKHQDSLLVILVWILAILISAIPWVMYKDPETGKHVYNFTQAVFECTSGYTTTGLSVVTPSKTPQIYLMYRSIMLFVGGIGLVLVMSCAVSDRYGLRLFTAEGHNDKLLPNLKKSARLIVAIYSCYIILGTIAYCIAGMSFFDGLNHSIAALSTGGFSTRDTNIMYYDSVAIDVISNILMLLGGTNFLIHLYLFKGQIKKVWNHCETKFIIFFTLAMVPCMAMILYFNNYEYAQTVGDAFNVAAFQFVSSLTTTGFSNIPDMNQLPQSFIYIMIILMLIGAGIGSTGGGIKQYRIVASFKGMYYHFKRGLLPKRAILYQKIGRGGRIEELSDDDIRESHNFVILYLIVFFIGSFIFSCFPGVSVTHAMFEFASSLGTVGITIGVTGYNAHPVILWTSTIGMFIGRLEILVVFNAFARMKKAMFNEK